MVTELLTDEQRHQLAAISTVRIVGVGGLVFEQALPADSVYIIAKGVLKAYHDQRSGIRRVLGFWFPSDIVGLAEGGRYVNTVEAITPATLYAIGIDALKASLRRDFALHLQFLCKVTYELRVSQQRMIALTRRDASGRFAMFLDNMQRNAALRDGMATGMVWLPMSRADIANYLGLTQETLSRATRRLKAQGLVTFPNRHHFQVLDPARLHKLADPF